MDRVTRFLIIGGGFGLLLICATATQYGAFAPQTICAVLVYAAAREYLFLFTITISSISSNILVRLSAGSLSKAQMDAAYDNRIMVGQRISRLAGTGFPADDSGRLVLTDKGKGFIDSIKELRGLFRRV